MLSGLTVRGISGDRAPDPYQALIRLLNWVFEVRITAEEQAVIERELLVGWYNADRSEQDLVSYFLKLYRAVFDQDEALQDNLRPQARAIFKALFEKFEVNDRGRVLATIQGIIEEHRAGASGAPLQLPQPAFDIAGTSPPPPPPAFRHSVQQRTEPTLSIAKLHAAERPTQGSERARDYFERFDRERYEAQRLMIESSIESIRSGLSEQICKQAG
jgi:hypothetical protein